MSSNKNSIRIGRIPAQGLMTASCLFLLHSFVAFGQTSPDVINDCLKGHTVQVAADAQFASAATSAQAAAALKPTEKKKRVLILYNKSGGGHVSAANAVTAALGEEHYTIEKMNIIEGMLPEEHFDTFFSTEQWTMLSTLVRLQFVAESKLYWWDGAGIKKTIADYQPDIIFSVFPVANFIYAEAARELNVPFMIVPTDIDPRGFVKHLTIDETNKDKLQFDLIFEDELLKKTLAEAGIHETVTIGYPIRKEMETFAKQYRTQDPVALNRIAKLKNEYSIGESDKTVMISMGAKGFGQKTTEEYIQTLVDHHEAFKDTMDGKLHVFLATGSNKDLYEKMKIKSDELKAAGSKIALHPEGMMDVHQMSDRMGASELLFIKPGGSTVGEAMAFNKKMLFKSDSGQALPWEQYNMLHVMEHGWGDALELIDSETGINKEDFIRKMKAGLAAPNDPRSAPAVNNFSENMRKHVDGIFKIDRK